MEIWKDINGYEGLYQVSNTGKVMSLSYRGTIGAWKILTPIYNKGYETVQLHKNGKTIRKYVHRLVAETFVPNPNKYKVVNHKDEDITNNKADNLEWRTAGYNVTYGHAVDKRSKQVRCVETGMIFKSMREADRYYGGNKGWKGYGNPYVSIAIKHPSRTAYGYHWVVNS